jgi:hypothetical protein
MESDTLSFHSGGGGETLSQHSSPSPLSTPQVAKRKSIHDRKLRPKSVVDSAAAEDYAPGKVNDVVMIPVHFLLNYF